MTPDCMPNVSGSVGGHTARFRRWGSWLAIFLLAGQIIFCHGCHGGDEDNELCVRPPGVDRLATLRRSVEGENASAKRR